MPLPKKKAANVSDAGLLPTPIAKGVVIHDVVQSSPKLPKNADEVLGKGKGKLVVSQVFCSEDSSDDEVNFLKPLVSSPPDLGQRKIVGATGLAPLILPPPPIQVFCPSDLFGDNQFAVIDPSSDPSDNDCFLADDENATFCIEEQDNNSAGGQDPITDELAHLEATEEAALKSIIWNRCSYILELCKKLSDQLYHRVLDRAAMLVCLIYDKDDLYRMGHSRIVYEQRSKFWDELEQDLEQFPNVRGPLYEACKWIVCKKVDHDRYSLLNENDVAALLSMYRSCPDRKPYLDFDDKEVVKSAFDDDIQEAIRKAKLFPRLTVDQYTCLLIEMARGESQEWLDLLLTKAVETIDIASYGLDASSIEDLMGIFTDCSAYEELYRDIEFNLLSILICKKVMVQREAQQSVMPFNLLFTIEFLEGPSSLGDFDSSKVAEYRCRDEEAASSVDIWDLIKVAELRRKAEGSRFITRDHFLWAFDQGGCGLRTAFKDELASRMAAEGHPPYHIYRTALTLANAEQQPIQAEHLAFAVVFGKFFDFSEEEVKEMQEDFQSFKTALRMRCVSPPNDWFMVSSEDKSGLWDDF
ncbi:hypothetical protein BVRB_5g115480 isoform A [Beta vulgaris subsp. vulgaris]|nr:hypothetical protein BVRB_5g115480 isoform A [Beta vulgaris subsp. vulgaris]